MTAPIQRLFRCVAIRHAANRTRPNEPRYEAVCCLLIGGEPAAHLVTIYSSRPDAFVVDREYLIDESLTVVSWQPAPDLSAEPAPPAGVTA